MNEERIVLGSGTLYMIELPPSAWGNGLSSYITTDLPTDEEIEIIDNILGSIKGGASLTYTPTYYEPKDDAGMVFGKYMTDEEAILKTGIMTINAEMLDKLIDTGQLLKTETTRILKIGGAMNQVDKKYLIHFVHKDAVHGDIRVSIVGNNRTGLEFMFAKNNETT